jgi:hypothetical protein
MGTIDDDDNAADPVDEVMAAGDEPSASSGGCSVGSSPISAGHLGWLALGRARQVSEPVLREATALGASPTELGALEPASEASELLP